MSWLENERTLGTLHTLGLPSQSPPSVAMALLNISGARRWVPRGVAHQSPLPTVLPLSRSKEDMLPAALSPKAQLAPSPVVVGGGGRSGERPAVSRVSCFS